MPDICWLAVPMYNLFNWLFLGKPSYYSSKVILVELEYKGALMRSKAYSGDIAFIEGGNKALEQLEIYI